MVQYSAISAVSELFAGMSSTGRSCSHISVPRIHRVWNDRVAVSYFRSSIYHAHGIQTDIEAKYYRHPRHGDSLAVKETVPPSACNRTSDISARQFRRFSGRFNYAGRDRYSALGIRVHSKPPIRLRKLRTNARPAPEMSSDTIRRRTSPPGCYHPAMQPSMTCMRVCHTVIIFSTALS